MNEAKKENEIEQVIELLRDMIDSHSDPECWEYNGCDSPEEECQWCVKAKALIELLTNKKGPE